MRLRLELFVKSVSESKDFYTRVLAFDEVSYQPDGYSVFRNGDIQIALQAQTQLPDEHPLKPMKHERAGLGIEIVLEFDDLDAMEAYGWEVAGEKAYPVFGRTTRAGEIVAPTPGDVFWMEGALAAILRYLEEHHPVGRGVLRPDEVTLSVSTLGAAAEVYLRLPALNWRDG